MDYQNCSVAKYSLTAAPSKPTIHLTDEPVLVAVRSIENANQDSGSQEVKNYNLKWKYLSNEHKSVPE